MSAVASAAAESAVCAAAAVASGVENEKSDYNEPDDLVIKKIAKTVHFILRRSTGAVLSFLS